jgi:hypothetical protein
MNVLASKGPKGLDEPHLQPVVRSGRVVLIWIRTRVGVPTSASAYQPPRVKSQS